MTTLHDLANIGTSHFQLKCWEEEQNTIHKPITWWDHFRSSAYMTIHELDARGITPELKLRLKFYCSWNLWFVFCCFLFYLFIFGLFVCLIIVGFLYLFLFLFFSILSTLPPASSHLCSHPFHSSSFSCAKIHCSPSLLYLFSSFLSTFFSCPHLPLPFSPSLSPDYPSPVHTHHLLTNLL
jgi:hypothetical protein